MNRSLAITASVLTGVTSAVAGLLPWLVTGMALPFTGIAKINMAPDEAPVALLPLSHIYLMDTAAMILVGSALAGAISRMAARRNKAIKAPLVVISTVVVQVIALAQSASVVKSGLQPTSQAETYFFILCVAVAMAIAMGVAVFSGLSRGGVPAMTVAATFGALALGPWISAVILPIGGDWMYGVSLAQLEWATTLSALIPLLIVGVLAGFSGGATRERVVATVIAFAAVVTIPKFVIAFGYAVSTPPILQDPQKMWNAGAGMFRDLLLSSAAVQQFFIVAVVALVTAIAMRTVRGGVPR